ncbi:ubiquitin carboxyl-terminal hydrolase 4 isoform X2 [Parasteatoda tepidariorum]|uniref:Ubiquitin carboxyl-terminal hydrolase n=1 Tax=Parasteatoda tepidariorum TaxID=114398 RepID=A0A2L2XYN7_PARTP|nr:ubiquitin carboxyl-terminal hydrolase 4 [Parasteatoda tepidariorum]
MAEGTSNIPKLEAQKNEISQILRKLLVRQDNWCLIDNKWFKQWKKYVGYDNWETSSVGDKATHPGPIDNSPLLRDDGSGEIKDHLIDELDYVLVPEEAWEKLVEWYGIVEGQQPIVRKVVEYGMFVKHCKVEVYLLEFKLCSNSDLEHIISKKFSKSDTIGFIEKEMRTLFNIPDDKETRLWNRYSHNTYEHLSNKDSTVQDAGLYSGQVLIIEEQNDDGTWPRQVKSTSAALAYTNSTSTGAGDTRSYNSQPSTIATRSYGNSGSYGNSSYSYDYHSNNQSTVQAGLCGLSNLGNTCFMNSALQCMSNTPPLADYFLQDHYWNELNNDNPLGMQGEIAKSFGDLIKNMWSGNCSYTVPRNFKMIVGRFAPQFSGYQQQDCQELMAFLLDGLHEDLNRVKKKPYIELSDADGRPDELVAKEAWENYLKRNNSIIVDTFHGLLKSTLVCPECNKVSVTFDPFCYLSLPLPLKKERQIEVLLVTLDPLKRHLKMKVTVPKLGIIKDLCEAISKISDIQPSNMIVADIYNHRLHKVFNKDEQISGIMERDEIFVYETPPEVDGDSSFMLPVYLKEKKSKLSQQNVVTTSTYLFGHPLFVPVPATRCSFDTLYGIMLKYMARFFKLPQTEQEWEQVLPPSTEIRNGDADIFNGDDYDSDPSDNDKNMDNDDIMKNAPSEQKRYLFKILSINAPGNLEYNQLKDSEEFLKLDRKMYLSLEFDEKVRKECFNEKEFVSNIIHESMNQRISQKKQVIQLSECLELFTTVEKLGADDPWYCPACKKHQQATKKFDLWSLPQVLIIHLKRFSYNRYWRDKLDTLVEFPVNGLNIAKYVLNPSHGPAIYDLCAVANHYGGMGGGHYTAYGKNTRTGLWYYFDDSSVSQSSEDNVVSKAAYVLFYMRRDASAMSHSSRHNISAALGAPRSSQVSSPDDDAVSSSDEDCNMDTN